MQMAPDETYFAAIHDKTIPLAQTAKDSAIPTTGDGRIVDL